MRLTSLFCLIALLLAAPAAFAQNGPTPYPDPSDESAWPGQGPIRVFQWMKDNRAFYWTQREKDQEAWVLVGDSLIGNWKGLKAAFPGRKVANRGIGGDVSRGVLFRLKEDVLDLKPKGIVLLIGTNDLSAHADPSAIESNISAILDQVKEHDPNIKVIVCTIPPRNSPKAPTREGHLEDANARIRNLAGSKDNAVLLDLHAAFANPDGTPRPELLNEDLLHLSAKGYERFAQMLQDTLTTIETSDAAPAAQQQ